MGDRCSTCNARVLWVTMAGVRADGTRATMPLDATPNDEGNVVYPWGECHDTEPPLVLARVERKDELSMFRGRGVLFTSHFQTCPDAAKHRKKKG